MADKRDESIHLILTDPPYCISRDTGFKAVKNGEPRFAVSMDFGNWDRTEIDLPKIMKCFYRLLKKGGTAIVFYDLWKISDLQQAMQQAGFKMLRLVVWEKTNPVPLNSQSTYLSNPREIAVLGVKGGKPIFNSQYDRGMYALPIERSRIHPTQKPLRLFEALIKKHSHPGDLVLDVFSGSGTTAVAAFLQGRDFTGCEADAGYVQEAQSRWEKVTSQPKSFITEPAKSTLDAQDLHQLQHAREQKLPDLKAGGQPEVSKDMGTHAKPKLVAGFISRPGKAAFNQDQELVTPDTKTKTVPPKQILKPMNCTELFLELAKPNEHGVSREVLRNEFVGKYQRLESTRDWRKKTSSLARAYHLIPNKTGGKNISFKLDGKKTNFPKKQ